MTPGQMAAAVLRRPFGGGSALAEPSSQEVYEGRLEVERPSAAGVNFLDVREAVPARVYEPADEAPVQAWAPWCEECRLPAVAAYSLGGAEYLARQHDIVDHHGAWTAEARPAAEVARLVAKGAR